MRGTGPFLWLAQAGSDHGFRTLPPAGLCLSTFVFLRHEGRLLLGRMADDPAWAALAGLDAPRRAAHSHGWTLPASHLKLGEDPREAAARIVDDILGLAETRAARHLVLSEPTVHTDHGEPARFPGLGDHFDVWFFVDARLDDADATLPTPGHYAALEWHDPRSLPRAAFARSHDEVVDRYLSEMAPAPLAGGRVGQHAAPQNGSV